MQKVDIYIYGSCHFYEKKEGENLLGDGGYGAVIVIEGEKFTEICGGSFPDTTNARMDKIAFIEAVGTLIQPSDISVYLSNDYMLKAFSLKWIDKWRKENFRERRHRDLWLEIDKILLESGHRFSFLNSKELKNNEYLNQAKLMAQNSSYKYP